MSVWSGLAATAVAIALAFVAAGQPIWEWKMEDPAQVETWSYGMFSARHLVNNRTSGVTTDRTYSYEQLAAIQPRIATAFQQIQLLFLLGLLAAAAAVALSIVTMRKRLRGIFAGIAFLGACAAMLYAAFAVPLNVPAAATGELADLGRGFPDFRGQTVYGSQVLTWTPVAGWVLVIAAGLALAWASADLWHLRTAKHGTKVQVEVTLRTARAPSTPPSPPPPPPAEFVTMVPEDPVIEEVFVIGSNGLLIKHMSRSLMSDKDRDVVGSMISAISSFIREAFTERDGEVHEVSLGDHRFVMCNETGLVVAVLVSSGETEDIVHRLKHLLAVLRDRYGDRLATWQGEALEGIEDELNVLWETYRLPPPPTT